MPGTLNTGWWPQASPSPIETTERIEVDSPATGGRHWHSSVNLEHDTGKIYLASSRLASERLARAEELERGARLWGLTGLSAAAVVVGVLAADIIVHAVVR